ncbi:MAG: RnfABCDGE type electron transport complex subunit D [Anaeromassilibacillus sp.]
MPSLQETPCLRKERSVPSLMWNVTLALCTLLVLPTVYYGWRPLAMAFVTVALCCLAEVAVCLVRCRTIHSDPSLLVTGLVIALLMPVNAPFGCLRWRHCLRFGRARAVRGDGLHAV